MTALIPDFKGHIYTPQDAEYDEARLAWLRNHDSKPALIAEVADIADAQLAVAYATEHGLPIAIQLSGHGAIKAADGAVLIKTHQLKRIYIDAEAQVATFESGIMMKDLVRAAGEHGLAPVTGDSPYVGATGFTLGGGQGWLSRQYGFGADSIISATLVTASGEIVTASADENADLLWGLKGGSGNFGVVVSLSVRVYPVAKGLAGAVYFDAAHAAHLVERYSGWALALPKEYAAFLQAFSLPSIPQVPEPIRGKRVVALQLFFNDASSSAKSVLKDFLDTFDFEPLANFTQVAAYADFVAGAPVLPPTAAIDVSGLQAEITADQIPGLARYMEGTSDFAPIIQIRPWGGVLAQPAPENLLQYGDVGYSLYATYPVTGSLAVARQQFADLERHIEKYATGKMFINFTADPMAMRKAYSETSRLKLRALKTSYDPHNLFCLGHTL